MYLLTIIKYLSISILLITLIPLNGFGDNLTVTASTGSAISTLDTYTDVLSTTINVTNVSKLLVYAEFTMQNSSNPNTTRTLTLRIKDELGTVSNEIMRYLDKEGGGDLGIGSLFYIFNVSAIGNKIYTLQHKNSARKGTETIATIVAMALDTDTDPYPSLNHEMKAIIAGVNTTSTSFVPVTGLITSAISLPVTGGFMVAASINCRKTVATSETDMGEWGVQMQKDGGGYSDIGNSIQRTIPVVNVDYGIITLFTLLVDQPRGDYNFQIVHRVANGLSTEIQTLNTTLVAVALGYENSAGGRHFACNQATVASASTASTTPVNACTLSSVVAKGTSILLMGQFGTQALASCIPSFSLSSSGGAITSNVMQRYLASADSRGAGGITGLVTGLTASNSYNLALQHYLPAGGTTITTTNIILGSIQLTDTESPGYWLGGTASLLTDWNTTGNWYDGAIPSSSTNVTIFDKTYDPLIGAGATANCKNLNIVSGSVTIAPDYGLTVAEEIINGAGNSGLVIQSDATGTGSLIELSGVSATVKRYITQYIYHYLSSPVSAQALTLLQLGTAHTDFDLFWYDEDYAGGGGPAWIDASAQAGNMDVGLGYAYTYNPADRTLEFTGTTNTGNISEGITFSGGDTWYYGWNLIGNPYPSRINATTFIDDTDNSNIYGTLYFWDEGSGYSNWRNDYAAWNKSGSVSGGGGHTPNGYIDVGQAFMVHTTTASTSVSFKNDMRVHDAAQFFKGEVQRFKISVENEEGYYNETLIAFLEGTTTGFDNKYDGYKLKGNPNIALYTKLVEDDGYDYAIQGLPPLTDGFGVTVKLGIDAGVEGIYTFNVVDIENFHDTTSIFLEDLYENITVNLRKTSEYTFNVNETGSITDRFLLHFNTSALGIDEPENINNRINVYTYDNIICVENYNPVGDIYVEVYNTLGQQLISRKLVDQQKNEITLNAGRGIYIVRIICEDKVFSSKVYLND